MAWLAFGEGVRMIADTLRRILLPSWCLYSFGRNNAGQLGLGDQTDRTSPTKVGTDTWIAAAGGYYHSLAINSDGYLYSFGRNNYGQLGLGDTTDRTSPTKVGTSTWTAVAAGYYHSLAMKE